MLRKYGSDMTKAAKKGHGCCPKNGNDAKIDELLEMINDPLLNHREIRGLDQALQTMRGELTLPSSKNWMSILPRRNVSWTKLTLGTLTNLFEAVLPNTCVICRMKGPTLRPYSKQRDPLVSGQHMREIISCILHEDTTLVQCIRTIFHVQRNHDCVYPHHDRNGDQHASACSHRFVSSARDELWLRWGSR